MSVINFSEFQTLAQCERKWAYSYLLNQEEKGERSALHLGTLIHLWHSRWLTGEGATLPKEWTDDINTGGKPGEVRTLTLGDFDSELVERATWLAGRFVDCYGPQPPSSWTVIGAEEWMTREFPWGTLVGRTDGLVEINDKLYLIEVKSYGSRPGPLAYARVSPQLGCYSLLCESTHGRKPDGIIYQGVYTYQWKPTVPTQGVLIDQRDVHDPEFRAMSRSDRNAWAKAEQKRHPGIERPAEDSFDDIEVVLGDDHLRVAINYLWSAIERRQAIIEAGSEMYQHGGLDFTVPNVGRDCSWCGFKAQCWNDLGGVEEFEIELIEDADGEPK